VGSRLGTHAIWTLTLSAAISLLALSPIVLPSGTPLEPLPGPLAGVERIGRVVASALLPHPETSEQPQAQATTPAPAGSVEASAPQTASGGGGVLAEQAGGERARPRQPAPDEPTRPEQPPPSVAPRPGGERTLDKAEAKAERHAEKAAAKAESKAERKDEKKDKKDKKEHGRDGGKKSHPAHGKGGKNHS
jgi:outer membrane biosynthesis protein TonB